MHPISEDERRARRHLLEIFDRFEIEGTPEARLHALDGELERRVEDLDLGEAGW